MGATNFTNIEKGRTAEQAFARAQAAAPKGGYTGTIAEKHGFKMISRPATFPHPQDQNDSTDLLGWADNKGWDNDKWDDCYCIEISLEEYAAVAKWYNIMMPTGTEKIFVFFGTASC